MANRLGRVVVGREVYAFNGHVSGENQLLPGRDLNQCGVIANTQSKAGNCPGRVATDPTDEFRFTSEEWLLWHGELEA
jgi:hypothetical protein